MNKYLNVDEVINMYGDDKHLLVVGKSGSGKTTFIKNYLNKFDEKRVYCYEGIDGHDDINGFKFSTEDELLLTLKFLNSKMNERYEVFQKAQVHKLKNFKEKVEKEIGRMYKNEFLVIDPLEVSLEKLSENKDFDEILRKGRASGIHILATCQSDVYLRRYGNIVNNFLVLNT